jgi:hypothetical protein
MAHPIFRLAATDIAPTRDLTPAGTLYTDGVGTTACGLEPGLQVWMFPDGLWEDRAPGDDCPVCAAGVKSSG